MWLAHVADGQSPMGFMSPMGDMKTSSQKRFRQ
jgi:hypothetical protein